MNCRRANDIGRRPGPLRTRRVDKRGLQELLRCNDYWKPRRRNGLIFERRRHPRSRVGVLHSTAGSARTRRPSTIFQHETFDRKSTHAARVAKSRSAEPGERCPDPPSGSPVPSSTSIQVLRLAVGSSPVLSDLDPRRRLTAVRPNLGPFSSPNIRTPMALGSTCNWHCSSATDRCAGPRSRRPASSPTSPETISFVASRPPLRCR